jgi:Ca-activated chloride channel homolog
MTAFPAISLGALHWGHPLVFLLCLVLPLPFLLALWLKRRTRGIRFPNLAAAQPLSRDLAQKLRHLPSLLRVLALVCVIAALARPQGELRRSDREAASLDLALALDVSDSMRADDLRPNRLTAAKRVLEQFIAARPQDRIALTIFSGASYTVMPLTTDHATLLAALQELSPGAVAIDGTAIGDGILSAVSRLLAGGPSAAAQPAPGRVVILATDGRNNRGYDPGLAAETAEAKGVRLYVVGLGSRERVRRLAQTDEGRLVPLHDVYGQPVYWGVLDEDLLKKLAVIGHGRYFRAADGSQLEASLDEIDRLEKQKLNVKTTAAYEELYAYPLLLALGLLVLERVLSRTRFRVLA